MFQKINDNWDRSNNSFLSLFSFRYRSIENNYVVHINLDAMIFRGSGRKIKYTTPLTGRPFLTHRDFRRLQKIRPFEAAVHGFAVLTEKRDACAREHEAKIDLVISALERMNVLFLCQGIISIQSHALASIGGGGAIIIEGRATLEFVEVQARKRRQVEGEPDVTEFQTNLVPYPRISFRLEPNPPTEP